MQDILVILISSILINNLVLTEFFGLSTLFGSPQKIEPVIGLSLATILLITLATVANFAVDRLIIQPFDLDYVIRCPGLAPLSGSSKYMPFSSAAANTMPSDIPNLILRGAKLATVTVNCPISFSGS